MTPLGPIHLIADLDVLETLDDPLARVTALLEAGLPSLSVRGPGRSAARLSEAGRAIREAARAHGAFFAVNGPPEAAALLDADGRHLAAAAPAPRTSPLAPDATPAADAAAPLPWGRSVHDAAELAAAEATGAHWVFLSPVFPTASKPGAPGLGIDGLAALARTARVPVWALGGITRENAAACLAAGAAGVAAIRGLLADDGPEWVRTALAAARTGRR